MAKKRRGPGRPFKPGVSGNPSGRPPGVRALLTRLAGDDGERLWEIAVKMAEGTYQRKVARYTMLGQKYEAILQPTIKEQREALQLILEHLVGRPVQAHELTGKDGKPIQSEQVKTSVLPVPDLDRLGELADLLTQVRAFTPSGGDDEASEASHSEVDEIYSAQAAPETSGVPPAGST